MLTADTKTVSPRPFGNDANLGDVDTKPVVNETFGNDGGESTSVDTKPCAGATFGNDGFIRVRRRKIKGGHPDMRAYRLRRGLAATTSASFDLVRAVRVNGK